jgi:hypothetical protein
VHVRLKVATALALVAFTACVGSGPTRNDAGAPAPTPTPGADKISGDWMESGCSLPVEFVERIRRGDFPGRSPEIYYVPRYPNYVGAFSVFTHSGPWGYLQRVPLVFYGPGFIRSRGELSTGREVTLADLAPTVAELLGVSLPEDRPGRTIEEVLVPEDRRPGKPRLILTIVWDGGGWNVLNAWPDAWPNLKRMMEEGASISNAIVGSSPTVTPAVHATIGTGAFPEQHGIVDIPLRDGRNVIGSSVPNGDTSYLELETLADIYDRSVGNEALVGMFGYISWHLTMMSHGSLLPGGDHDIAMIAERREDERNRVKTYPQWYSLPGYLRRLPGFERDVRTVDQADGKLDGAWLDNAFDAGVGDIRKTPVWVLYQTRLLEEVLEREGFGDDDVTDLFYINYKQIDEAGHRYNMLEPEMSSMLQYSDDELEDIEGFLNDTVGENRWVIVLTADHGSGPQFQEVGAWPIRFEIMLEDMVRELEVPIRIFQDHRPGHIWLNRQVMKNHDVSAEEMADWLIDYRLEENLNPDEEVQEQYQKRFDERIIQAAWPAEEMERIWSCARSRAAAGG